MKLLTLTIRVSESIIWNNEYIVFSSVQYIFSQRAFNKFLVFNIISNFRIFHLKLKYEAENHNLEDQVKKFGNTLVKKFHSILQETILSTYNSGRRKREQDSLKNHSQKQGCSHRMSSNANCFISKQRKMFLSI